MTGALLPISEWVVFGLKEETPPQLYDPFVDFAVLSSQGQTENIPPFGFDTIQFQSRLEDNRGRGINTTGRTSSNSTHSIVVELIGDPPRITSIETYSGDEEQFAIRVRTGEDVELSVTQGLTRAPLV